MAGIRIESGQSSINAIVGHLWRFVRAEYSGAFDLEFETGFERIYTRRMPLYCTTRKDLWVSDFRAGEKVGVAVRSQLSLLQHSAMPGVSRDSRIISANHDRGHESKFAEKVGLLSSNNGGITTNF